ncbi:hypothetical protein [Brachyspira innocens]|uniref:hypothetical protein n=1 Tax=Brachyspira innocens TaxID=13264 RepID=UPI0026F043F3|nr:hypothetical protein [Brachyspira innocens]
MEKLLNDIVNIYKDIIYETLNDEYELKQFINILKNNLKKKNKKIFLRNFNSIIIENEIPDLNIKTVYTDFRILLNCLQYLEKKRTSPIYNNISDILCEEWFPMIELTILYSSGTIIGEFEFKIQLFLSELAKLPDKERIIQIFYDEMARELPEIRYINTETTYSISNNNVSDSYPSYITVTSYDKNTKKDEAENIYILSNLNKKINNTDIIKEKIINYIPKCKDKLKEIKELSKDFEYAVKMDYYKDCDNIEYRLNNCNDNSIEELNKIADEINTLYRNAYNKKNNKSSLYYVMDIEDDDIDLIDHI